MAVTTTDDGIYAISSGNAAEVLGAIKAVAPGNIVAFNYDGTNYHVLYQVG